MELVWFWVWKLRVLYGLYGFKYGICLKCMDTCLGGIKYGICLKCMDTCLGCMDSSMEFV